MNRRYRSFSEEMKKLFGGRRLVKLGINAGFSCPNRDGKIARDGCLFCSEGASEFAGCLNDSIAKQMCEQKRVNRDKWKDSVFCAYFQSFTNTYAAPEVLRGRYEEALSDEEVVALAVATRPDCLSDDVLDVLTEFHQRCFLWIELGLQTIHDETAEKIRRGYPFSVYENAVRRLKARGIRFLPHLIFGLPGETRRDVLQSVRRVSEDRPFGIKFHSLFVERGTALAASYERGELELWTEEEYCETVCEAITLLPPEVVIHRLTGDADKKKLIAPLWSADKKHVLSRIHFLMKERDAVQGMNFGETDCKEGSKTV